MPSPERVAAFKKTLGATQQQLDALKDARHQQDWEQVANDAESLVQLAMTVRSGADALFEDHLAEEADRV